MPNSNKKVVALSCSPSKGRNSDSMLDSFMAGVEEIAGIEIEKVYLDDIPFENYNHKIKDGPQESETGFKELIDKIQNSCGLVIATPTYNFSVPAGLKNFIDRIRFFALDFGRKTKLGQPVGMLGYLDTYFLVSGGTPTWAEKILFFTFPAFWLRGVFIYFGSGCMGAIYSGDIRAYENKRILKKCQKAGRKYAKGLMSGKHQGILERIFWRPPQSR